MISVPILSCANSSALPSSPPLPSPEGASPAGGAGGGGGGGSPAGGGGGGAPEDCPIGA